MATDLHAGAESLPRAARLRCEYLENPLGLDVVRPRLSWQLADARRGARQTAYRVLVASAPEGLRAGQADVWDSGRVASDQSAHVLYDGPPLRSRRRYWWQVQVWDQNGTPLRFSEPAWWEMGLLDRSDWRATWIASPDAGQGQDTGAGVEWIWSPEGAGGAGAAPGRRCFRVAFDLPAGGQVEKADLYLASDTVLEAGVNGNAAGRQRDWDRRSFSAFRIDDWLRPGRNVVTISADQTGKPVTVAPGETLPMAAGMAALVTIRYADGGVQRVPTDARWKVSADPGKAWTEPGFDDADWGAAAVLAGLGDAPWGEIALHPTGGPAPLLRKTFTLKGPVKSARVYVTALGSYRLHLNGRRVGNDVLTPDFTDYRKHILYQAYDVTDLLREGSNVVGAILGDGWYAGGLGWNHQRYGMGPPPTRLLLQMHVEYPGGGTEVIASDGSWKAAPGPILRSELYAGETYDARREAPGWDRAGFDDGGWGAVRTLPAPDAPLSGRRSPAIQITETIRPESVASPAPGVYVYDMGQNMVGWVRLTVKGTAGTKIRLRFTERLRPDGSVNWRGNLRFAEATDTYILKGGGEETFEPHFTYHGFRYVEVVGYPDAPGLDDLAGCVLHTAAPFSGRFSCSSEPVNRLWRNTLWGQRGNLHGVPTDCPQRDERLGWMGDAQVFWRTACYNMDLAAFSHKWLRDVREAQSEQGAFANISPRVADPADGAPAWGDAGVIVPWEVYRHYGDRRVLEENWDAMDRWMAYVHQANPDLIWNNRRSSDFGDWLAPDNKTSTPKDLVATAYWAYDARLMARMARALGKEADAERYEELFGGIRAAFAERFVRDNGEVGNGSQTGYVMALHMDLLSPDKRAPALNHLVRDIEARGNHLATGFIGTAYLLPVLTESGRGDVAYRLLLQDTFPSWLYMVGRGATTLWERWNGDAQPLDSRLNSHNHFAFGAVAEWLYRHVGGIDTDPAAPGFKRIIIRPRPGGGLTGARAEYDSLCGPIVSQWSSKPGEPFRLDVTVPASTTATVYVPTDDPARVTESGAPVGPDSATVRLLRREDGCAVYAVAAGTYRFAVEQ